MFLVPTQQPHNFVDNHASLHASNTRLGSEATIDTLLSSPSSMERSAPEYSQSGLPSPYPSNFGDSNSEESTADHASAAQYPVKQDGYPVKQEVNYSTSATPTSEYGVYPQSARSGSFPEHIQRSYHPASSTSSGGMAQQQNNPSIAAPSPTYPYGQHSPYAPNPDMSHSYSHPSGGIYTQPRPDWGGYGQHGGTPLTPGHPVYAQSPASAPPQQRPNQVYSFVPIPGAQQHKRPRRRYEEIERMYKCGWNGCEKAYGTLNHLNAHVTMQSHGQKRTPEEFKEIRKEWKQRKKEEEAQRKAEEERQRQAESRQAQDQTSEAPLYGQIRTTHVAPPPMGGPQLPPLGYAPASGGAPASYGTQSPGALEGINQYANNNNQIYANANSNNSSYPQSPYGQPNQMYQQRRPPLQI